MVAEKAVFEIRIKLKDSATRAFKRLGGAVRKFAAGARRAFIGVGKALLSMKTLIAAVVAGLVVRQLAKFIQSVADMGDEVAKTSQKIGVTVEELSEFRFSAELAGTSLSGMEKGLKQLSRNMFDFSEGMGEARIAFEKLGITVTKADGKLRPVGKVFSEISDKFKGMQDGAEKTALAMILFGRAGAEMIPLLNQGSEELKKINAQARFFGLIFTTSAARAAERFNDSLVLMKRAFDGLKITALTVVLKPLAAVFEEFALIIARNKDEIAKFVKESLPGLITFFESIAFFVTGIIAGGVGILKGFASAVLLIVTGLSAMVDVLGNIVSIGFDTHMKGITAAVKVAAGEILAIISEVFRAISSAFQKAGEGKFFSRVTDNLAFGFDAARSSLGNLSAEMLKSEKVANSYFKELFTVSELTKALKKETLSLAKEARGGLTLAINGLKAAFGDLSIEMLNALPLLGRIAAIANAARSALLADPRDDKKPGKEVEERLKSLRQVLEETFGADLRATLEGAFQGFFESTITGIDNLRQAFKNLVVDVLRGIAQMIAKLLASKLVSLLLGSFGLGGSTPIPGNAQGGILPGSIKGIRPLAQGGIISSPTLALIGEGSGPEAVVPLSGGRSIPVELRGAGAGGATVNITINALDAPGVKALLLREKELITNIISNATRTSQNLRRNMDL